jgi:membrane protease YdiL (CAAX protease family)
MPEAQSSAVRVAEANRVNRAFAGVGAALGLGLWAGLFGLPLFAASLIVIRTHPHLGRFLGFLSQLSVVPGILWVARAKWGTQWRKALPLAPVGSGLLLWTGLWVVAFIPANLAWALAVERTFGPLNLPDPIASVGVLGLILGAPVAEEILCRGYGLARIRELAGDRRALLYTALVFALLHGSWVKLPGTFTLGLFLGWLVLRTGSLWPAFVGHFLNNGIALILD